MSTKKEKDECGKHIGLPIIREPRFFTDIDLSNHELADMPEKQIPDFPENLLFDDPGSEEVRK